MMKDSLAKARDNWLASEDGKQCCGGTTTGRYLQNRLESAFIAGAEFSKERIKDLETGQLDFAKEMEKILKTKIQRIAELKTALESIWPFIEDDFPKGTGDNHGTCATDSYLLAARQIEQTLKKGK